MKRSAPLKRTPMKRKRSANGFGSDVRDAALLRSKGVCEIGSRVCTGRAEHLHHRKLRRFKDNRLANALYVCAPCHGDIHQNPGVAEMMGWIVPSWLDPVDVDVLRGERWSSYH